MAYNLVWYIAVLSKDCNNLNDKFVNEKQTKKQLCETLTLLLLFFLKVPPRFNNSVKGSEGKPGGKTYKQLLEEEVKKFSNNDEVVVFRTIPWGKKKQYWLSTVTVSCTLDFVFILILWMIWWLDMTVWIPFIIFTILAAVLLEIIRNY